MPRHLYALLVGVNNYPNPAHRLNGCVSDMEGWHSYLERHSYQMGYQFEPLILRDQAATRQAVIHGFRRHLSQAQSDDLAVFFFGGHGSLEPGNRAFGQDPEREQNQTLVCWDSREPGGQDLVDKELSSLIANVAQNCPQITVILDCCHSGSGSRLPDVKERKIPPRRDERSLESYDFAPSQVIAQPAVTRSGRQPSPSQAAMITVRQGQHLLLSACHESQTAKEFQDETQARGFFSFFMQRILNETERPLPYAELLAQVRIAMRQNRVPEQEPQLEVIEAEHDLSQCFFLTQEQSRDGDVFCTLFYEAQADELAGRNIGGSNQSGRWLVDRGSLQGWPEEVDPGEIQLAIYPMSSQRQAMGPEGAPLARATVVRVKPTESTVVMDQNVAQDKALESPLDPQRVYQAQIVQAPLSMLKVAIEGHSEGDRVKQVESIDSSEVKLQSVADSSQAHVVVRVESERCSLLRGGLLNEPRQVALATFAKSFPLDQGLGRALAQISRWHQLATLQNPRLGSIPRSGVRLELIHRGQVFSSGSEQSGSEVCLSYEKDALSRLPSPLPSIQLRLVNETSMRLYCGLFDLSSEFEIDANLLEAGGVWLEPQQVLEVGEFEFELPPGFLEQGVTEYQNLYKLIVSTQVFDARAWQQSALTAVPERRSRRKAVLSDTADWMTQSILVRNIWPGSSDGTGADGIGADELWQMDEALLMAALGELEQRSPVVTERPLGSEKLERSPVVTERPLASKVVTRSPVVTERPLPSSVVSTTQDTSQSTTRSPVVTERPLARRSELMVLQTGGRGVSETVRVRGRAAFAQINAQAYRLLCSPIGELAPDLAVELTQLLNQKTEKAAAQSIDLLGPLLVGRLGLPQSMAMVAATLLVKKAAAGTSDFVCENWKAQ